EAQAHILRLGQVGIGGEYAGRGNVGRVVAAIAKLTRRNGWSDVLYVGRGEVGQQPGDGAGVGQPDAAVRGQQRDVGLPRAADRSDAGRGARAVVDREVAAQSALDLDDVDDVGRVESGLPSLRRADVVDLDREDVACRSDAGQRAQRGRACRGRRLRGTAGTGAGRGAEAKSRAGQR